jgi:hypothetical protein
MQISKKDEIFLFYDDNSYKFEQHKLRGKPAILKKTRKHDNRLKKHILGKYTNLGKCIS